MAKILIVDDAAFARIAMAKMLEEIGHTPVAQAENGIKALEAYKAYHPDIVLMDITMPEMDGIQSVTAIKSFDPKAKIIMVSAMGQQEKVFQSIAAGAMDFIVKPAQKDMLAASIEKNMNVLL